MLLFVAIVGVAAFAGALASDWALAGPRSLVAEGKQVSGSALKAAAVLAGAAGLVAVAIWLFFKATEWLLQSLF